MVGSVGDDDSGSFSGSAYVHQRHEGGSNTWGPLTKLVPYDGAESDFFGRSVDVSGGTVIGGALGQNAIGSGAGAAYIFDPFTLTFTSSVTVDLTVDTGAAPDALQWRVDGRDWQPSGATVDDVPVGEATIEYRPTLGLAPLPPDTITVERGQLANLTTDFDNIQTFGECDLDFARPEFKRLGFPSRILLDESGGVLAFRDGILNSAFQRSGAVIRLDEAEGGHDPSFFLGPQLSFATATAVDADGEILIAGFLESDLRGIGEPTRVLRAYTDGTLDPDFQAPLLRGGSVRTITVQPDGNILVGGLFDRVDDDAVTGLIRLNADGNLDQSFNIPILDDLEGISGTGIWAPIVLDGGGNIYIGGRFGAVNGAARQGFARLLSDGSLDDTFPAGGYTLSEGRPVRGIGITSDDKVIIGGLFMADATGAEGVLVRLRADGSFDDTFTLLARGDSALDTQVRQLAVLADNTIVAVDNTVARYLPDGALDDTFHRPVLNDSNLEGNGFAFWLAQGAGGTLVIAGGRFLAEIDGLAVPGIARLNADGTLDNTFSPPGLQREIYPTNLALQSDGLPVVWDGRFSLVNGISLSGLARFDLQGSVDDTLDLSGSIVDFLGLIRAGLTSDDRIYYLASVGPDAVNAENVIGRLLPDGAPDGSFSESPVVGNRLFVLGDDRVITTRGGQQRQVEGFNGAFVRINYEGGVDGSFIGLQDYFGGVERDHEGNLALIWVVEPKILAEFPDGRLLVSLPGPNQTYLLARLHYDGTFDESFAVGTISGGPPEERFRNVRDPERDNERISVTALFPAWNGFTDAEMLPDGNILVSGQFFEFNGHFSPGLVKLDPDGNIDHSFSPGSGARHLEGDDRAARIDSITVDWRGRIYLIGVFDEFNDALVSGLVRLHGDGAVDTTFFPELSSHYLFESFADLRLDGNGRIFLLGQYRKDADIWPYGLHVLLTNLAPVLDSSGDPFLSASDEDDINNSGTSVAELLARLTPNGSATDPDGDTLGIAVVEGFFDNGSLQFDAQANGDWFGFGGQAEDRALLLGPDSLIRFRPSEDFNGPVDPVISFRLWDQSEGTAGDRRADTTINGGETAFSVAIEAASIEVGPIPDAPKADIKKWLVLNDDDEIVIDRSKLSFFDPDDDVTALEISYTLTSLAAQGTLKLGGAALNVNDTFSQEDIDNGLLSFASIPGAAGIDMFNFQVSASSGIPGDQMFGVGFGLPLQVKRLLAGDGIDFDQFGISVAVSEDTAVVGARLRDSDGLRNSGAAYVFERNVGGADSWSETAILLPGDPADSQFFGEQVDIDGDTIVVGAPRDPEGGTRAGAAYVFQRDDGDPTLWQESIKLRPADLAEEDRFGSSVSIRGDTIAVGSLLDDDADVDAGSAYIFERPGGGDNTWTEVAKLLPSAALSNGTFGNSIALSEGESTVVVGQPRRADGIDATGVAYVFGRDVGGADAWGEADVLSPNDGADFDLFGIDVDISGDTIAVGSLFSDPKGEDSGSVYLYERNTIDPNQWDFLVKLAAVDGDRAGRYGRSVALDGDSLVVGSVGDDDSGSFSGSAYVHQRNEGGAGSWGLVTKLVPYDGAPNDLFGRSVDLNGGTVIGGASGHDARGSSAGAAYIFDPFAPPIQPAITSASVADGTVGHAFGFRVTTNFSHTHVSASGLPQGLIIHPFTGWIVGVPLETGTFPVSLMVENSAVMRMAELDLTINPPPPVITSRPFAQGRQFQDFFYHITATRQPTSYNAIGLPNGLGVDTGTGVISGQPQDSGLINVTLEATNAGGTSQLAAVFHIRHGTLPPAILSPSFAAGRVAEPFGHQLVATNSPTNYATDPDPPAPGLAINSVTGLIHSTPTQAGIFQVEARATNPGGTGTQDLSIIILPSANLPEIVSPVRTAGRVGVSFSFTLDATENPTSYTAINLPPDLAVDTATGEIFGLPSLAGLFVSQVAAAKAFELGEFENLAFLIRRPLLVPVMSNAPVVRGQVGASLSFQLKASNNPTSFSASTLPDGLVLNNETGEITGTPLPTALGVTNVQVFATNGDGDGDGPSMILQFRIAPAPNVPRVAGNTDIPALVGEPFTYQIQASGDPTAYVVEALDPQFTLDDVGLELNADTGLIAGTPVINGTFGFLLTATNDDGTSPPAEVRIIVAPPPTAPEIVNADEATGRVLEAFQFQIVADGGTILGYAAEGLPSGLEVDPASGLISGTPVEAFDGIVLLSATNEFASSGIFELELVIEPSPLAPVITSSASHAGVQNAPLTPYPITATNTPLLFQATNLPEGLRFNPFTGIITGIPVQSGTTNVFVSASNAVGASEEVPVIFTIQPDLNTPVVTSSTTVSGSTDADIAYTVEATDMPVERPLPPGNQFNAVDLIPGLNLNPATGEISGRPEDPGIFHSQIWAENEIGQGPRKTLTFLIQRGAEFPTVVRPSFRAGQVDIPVVIDLIANIEADGFELVGGRRNFETYDQASTDGHYELTPLRSGTVRLRARGGRFFEGDWIWGAFHDINVTIIPAQTTPVITSPSPALGQVGTFFSYTFTASENPTGFSVIFSPFVPPGLLFDPATQVISGTPELPGPFVLTAQAENAAGTGLPKDILLVFEPAPGAPGAPGGPGGLSAGSGGKGKSSGDGLLAVSSVDLTADGQVGIVFGFPLEASGNPDRFEADGLPPDLGINEATGEISGIPAQPGIFLVEVTAFNDSGEGSTSTLELTIEPAAGTPVITSALADSGQVGENYSYQIAADENPTSFNASNLPSFLNLDGSTGDVSGTLDAPGSYKIELSANNSIGTGGVSVFTLTVFAASDAPVITSSTTVFGMANEDLNYQITADNDPLTFFADNLPAGLSIDEDTGEISGTPLTPGEFDAQTGAENSAGTSNLIEVTFLISPAAGTSNIISSDAEIAIKDESFNFVVEGDNSPVSFNFDGLAGGFVFDPLTGDLSGTPNTTDTIDVTFSANNANGQGATQEFTLQVADSRIGRWRIEHFASDHLDFALSGEDVDPDADGAVNLIEYVLASDPNLAQGALPFNVVIATDGNDDYLAVEFDRRLSATDVNIVVEVSSDLENWSSGGGFTNAFTTKVSIEDPDPNDDVDTVTVRDNMRITDETRRFIRARFETVSP